MDIRIGNDVRLSAPLSDMNGYTADQIKSVRAMFINTSDISKDVCRNSFPQSCNPTKYTIHGCGMPTYNVLPEHDNCRHAQNRGFCVYCDYSDPRLSEDEGSLYVYFPSEKQTFTGTYKVVLEVKVNDDDWKDEVRTFVKDYGNTFTLTLKNTNTSSDINLGQD